jgi:hypothetical protein
MGIERERERGRETKRCVNLVRYPIDREGSSRKLAFVKLVGSVDQE